MPLPDITLYHNDVIVEAKRAVAGGPEDTTLFDRQLVSSYTDTEDALQPGTRSVQVRSILQPEDLNADSNGIVYTVVSEITVVRSLNIDVNPSDEQLYRTEEMLYGMGRLLETARWQANPFVDQVRVNPEVTEEPERSGNTITYTVAFTVRLIPS